MIKELYVYRDVETNKVEKIIVMPIWSNHDEDRTWFYYEGLIELDDIVKLIK